MNSNLAPKDLERIEAIENYLTYLNTFNPAIFNKFPLITPPKIEEQSLYVRRIKEADTLTNGSVYKVENAEGNYYDIKNDMGFIKSYFKQYFTVVSEQEYTAQEEPKEIINESKGEKYKVEIVHTITGDCGVYILSNTPMRKLKAQEIAEKIKQLLKTL